MEGDEGLSAFHPFSEERRISGTAGEIISSGTAGEIISMHSKTDLHIWRGSVFAWEMYEGVFLLFPFDCLFSFFQPVHEKRGERGKDAEGDEYPADGGGEQNGDIIARKSQASAEASFADRP